MPIKTKGSFYILQKKSQIAITKYILQFAISIKHEFDINEYGAEGLNADWIYKIPITQKAFLSILEGSAFKYLNLTCGEDFKINIAAFVFLEKRDGLQMSTQEEMRLFLMQHLPNCFVDDTLDSDHDIIGVEKILAERIVHWIKTS